MPVEDVVCVLVDRLAGLIVERNSATMLIGIGVGADGIADRIADGVCVGSVDI